MIRPEDLPQIIPSDLPPRVSGPQWGDQDRTYRVESPGLPPRIHTVPRETPCPETRTRDSIFVVGTTANVRVWTPEELAEWLRATGCPSERAAWIMEQLTNPPPVTVVRIEPKEPA